MKGTILYVGNFELPDKGAAANRVVSNGKLFRKLGYGTAYLGIRKDADFAGVQLLDAEQNMYEEKYPQCEKYTGSHRRAEGCVHGHPVQRTICITQTSKTCTKIYQYQSRI